MQGSLCVLLSSSLDRATHRVLSSFVVACALFSCPRLHFSSKEAKIISRDSVFTNRSNPIDSRTVCREWLISSCDRSRSLRSISSGHLRAAMANYFNGLFFDFIARPTEKISSQPTKKSNILIRSRLETEEWLRLGLMRDSAAVIRVGKVNNLQPIS